MEVNIMVKLNTTSIPIYDSVAHYGRNSLNVQFWIGIAMYVYLFVTFFRLAGRIPFPPDEIVRVGANGEMQVVEEDVRRRMLRILGINDIQAIMLIMFIPYSTYSLNHSENIPFTTQSSTTISKHQSKNQKYQVEHPVLSNTIPTIMSAISLPRQTTAFLTLATTGVFIFLPPTFFTKTLFLIAVTTIAAIHRHRTKRQAQARQVENSVSGAERRTRRKPSEKQLAQIRHQLFGQKGWEKKAELPMLDH
ncbi:hypothetical protein ACMFMG_000287 [Clarireedia jacksonii]